MIELPEHVLECDGVLCKRVEHIKMIDELYASFVFACYKATKEATPHTSN